MINIICFIVGLIIGILVGVFIMCALQMTHKKVDMSGTEIKKQDEIE